jgi:hypothetical protein
MINITLFDHVLRNLEYRPSTDSNSAGFKNLRRHAPPRSLSPKSLSFDWLAPAPVIE